MHALNDDMMGPQVGGASINRDSWNRLLRIPSFRALLAGQFISLLGSSLTLIALPWFVLATTGSATRMGIVVFAETAPQVVLGIPAAIVVGRLDLKRFMVAADLARGLAVTLLPALQAFGLLRFEHVVAAAFVNGLLLGPYLGTRMALVPAITGNDEATLLRANTLLQLAIQLSGILGPLMGGALLARFDPLDLLYLDGASFLFAGAVTFVGVRGVTPTGRVPDPLVEFRAALAFIRRSPLVRDVTTIGTLALFGVLLLTTTVLPLYVRDVLRLRAPHVALLMATWGLGSSVGMLVYVSGARRPGWRGASAIRWLMIGVVTPFWLLPTVPLYPVVVAGFAVSAICAGPVLVFVHTTLQMATPRPLQGAVFTAFNGLLLTILPIGIAVSAPVLDRSGPMPVLFAIAGIMTLSTALTWTLRSLREVTRADGAVPAQPGATVAPARARTDSESSASAPTSRT